MRTDKQIFKVFEARPAWVFELAGLPSPGESTMRSFIVKALQRTSDGLVVPDAPGQPLTVVEFQFQKDDTVYLRIVVEMAAVQEAYPGRAVQGVIFFGYNIKRSQLTAACKRTLEEVFVSWLEQRLKHRQKKEIEIMLVGELPDLEETASGKDLIRIGEQRGEKRGREKTILAFLAARHGAVPEGIRDKVAALPADEAERLVQFLPRCQTLDELAQWLTAHPPPGAGRGTDLTPGGA